MPVATGLKRLEQALEKALPAGWAALDELRLRDGLVAYGVIAPEGMESLEPFALTRDDAVQILRQWESPELDPRCAIAFPAAVHQGERLTPLFAEVAAAYLEVEIDEQAVMENESRVVIEGVVTKVFRRLIKRGVFGERRAESGGPFLGFFGYETSEEQLAGHLRELNPAAWVDEWVAEPADTPPGELVSRGKPAVEVAMDDVSFHAASGLLVNTAWVGLVRFWDLGAFDQPVYSRADLDHGVTAHALSEDGREVYLAWRGVVSGFGVQAMNVKTRKRRDLGIALSDACWSLAAVPERPWLTVGTGEGRVMIWDVEADRLVREWDAHANTVRALRYTGDGAILYSGAREDGLRAWDAETGAVRFSVAGLNVETLLPTPDESLLVTLACDVSDEGCDEVVTVLDARSGTVVRESRLNPNTSRGEFDHLERGAKCAAISDDGTRLALGVGFGEGNAHLRLLDFPSGRELARVNVGHEAINGVVFAPGDRRRVLFTGRHFRGAQLYDWTAPE